MYTTTYLRKHLGGLDAGDDRVVAELLAAALGRVAGGTNRTFDAPGEVTEYLDGNGEQSLELSSAVASGTPLLYLQSGETWTAVATTNYYVSRNPRLGISNMVTLHATRWPFGWANVKAVYTGGYAAGSEPGEIRDLVLRLVSWSFAARLPGASPPEPADMAAILDRWRISRAAPQTRLVRA